jgi:hypothetical protein
MRSPTVEAEHDPCRVGAHGRCASTPMTGASQLIIGHSVGRADDPRGDQPAELQSTVDGPPRPQGCSQLPLLTFASGGRLLVCIDDAHLAGSLICGAGAPRHGLPFYRLLQYAAGAAALTCRYVVACPAPRRSRRRRVKGQRPNAPARPLENQRWRVASSLELGRRSSVLTGSEWANIHNSSRARSAGIQGRKRTRSDFRASRSGDWNHGRSR